MWSNLKKGIDSFIAEEQARQRAAQQTPPRPAASASASRVARQAASGARASGDRARTPDRRGAVGEQASRGLPPTSDPTSRGPDPSEFEPPEFVIGDEDGGSRSSTPANVISRTTTPDPAQAGGKVGEVRTAAAAAAAADGDEKATNKDGPAQGVEKKEQVELPPEVRGKLRKLERLESRYQELLKSYRVAHARVSAVEIFEAALREHTPLTSINDSNAFVEYLNQNNLKSDMVLDELKKVSNEKNKLQTRLDDAEKEAKDAKEELATMKKRDSVSTESTAVDPAAKDDVTRERPADKSTEARLSLDSRQESTVESARSPPLAGMLKTAGMSIFSPKKTSTLTSPTTAPEELFSYDSEVPRLESELGASQQQVTTLKKEVTDLRNDLTVARESTQSMVQTLEEATRDANQLREQNEELRASTESEIGDLRTELEQADGKMRRMQIELEQKPDSPELSEEQKQRLAQTADNAEKLTEIEKKLKQAEHEKAELSEKLQAKETEHAAVLEHNTKRSETMDKLIKDLRSQIKSREQEIEKLTGELSAKSETVQALQAAAGALQSKQKNEEAVETRSDGTDTTKTMPEASKKKNKKKKGKSGQTAKPEGSTEAGTAPQKDTDEDIHSLRQELATLQEQVNEKDAAIERLNAKLKDQEILQEEIETLRDDLINVGQEHVDAKESIKKLEIEKSALKEQISTLETELTELRDSASSSNMDERHADLTKQYEELKIQSTILQTDLAVANQLASSRFKDLQDLRSALQKAQPELTSLRKDNTALKTARAELQVRLTELEKIETRHSTVKSELMNARKLIGEKDSEIGTLSKRLSTETSAKEREEENRRKAVRSQETAESEKRQANQSLERAQKELAKAREDLTISRTRASELEGSLSKVQRETDNLKEEIELKSAQHASAESLMTSMRDQTSEMATQSKETRERCESLEEEVAEAHRLLGERSREAETMRRLLNEIEGRTEARVREMKDRLDAAIEERDRVEDEASSTGRRRGRELEEMRTRLRDAERDLKRTEGDNDELEAASREWRRKRDELESRAETAGKEAEEVRKAMGALRDALDESESQARELERQKSELARSIEDVQQRLERAQKSNKIMAEEVRNLQNTNNNKKKGVSGAASSGASGTIAHHSPRGSLDASRSPLQASTNGQGSSAASSEAYLKNVLLQFLETREQKHRVQLIPVLGMLLHFDKMDEQKWMAAISAKS